ncbi:MULTISPECIES: adenylate/guanylate cyclase domain-containing protein [unclassified Pseudoalteromonas]|uniref:adenylate/guanylate cyclase domain-containing protein n=1 Tax=unclassified Pseudoalteromonas TaxID=194690 RepID=UPI002096C003|nr:adenylate/guanylate cyclase domain-containing protein [Pseudoalteromonas sp. XMcav2-N]MCO7189063.1 adenylate/guanylate cyclase domain-containing protein [Pseudoalteromonas sp. XMcav2-N]
MKWLKDIDSSFDKLLTDCYQRREMEMELHVNKLRFYGLMALFVTELVIGLYSIGWDSTLIAVDLGTLAIVALWCALVMRWAMSDSYKPWLKYVSILFDYAIILAVSFEIESLDLVKHLLQDLHKTEFELMLVSVLLLFNIMSAFRQGKLIIYFSTLCCLLTGTLVLEHSHTARAIEIHEQVIIVCSGFLAWSLSSYITGTYTKLRHRERLLRYLPEQLVKAVERGEVDIEPGGEKRDVTVLMADIRGFTRMCEQHDPEVITRLLNRYFSRMSSVIFSHQGMIDKFIGDAIMAVFGTPQKEENNARNAIEAAREMLKALKQLNQEFSADGLPEIKIGIGIHSGDAIAGNVGSSSCMDYTVIGDTVNVAARIESKTKELQHPILVSEQSVQQSKLTQLKRVAMVELSGRSQPIEVYHYPD